MRGQLQHPINWILILFGGAFFLLLFITIARTVIDTSEGLGEATTINALTNTIDRTKANPETTVELQLPELITICDSGAFTIRSGNQERTIATHALFGPESLAGPTTVSSQEFSIVNPITTLTYLYPHDTLYLLDTGLPESLIERFDTIPGQEFLPSQLSSIDISHPRAVIISDDPATFQGSFTFDAEIHGILTAPRKVTFYEYEQGQFTRPQEHNSPNEDFLAAAIVAGTRERYACGLITVTAQAQFLAALNTKRTEELLSWNPPLICQDAYRRALSAYNDLANLENIAAVEFQLLSASKTLGDNGCPNI